tara:strand:- start:5932 stop:7203 length:1272 start_codon:yes stop_codon:yes gene_type:complete
MLIIGNKPLLHINIDNILDTFEKNIRFNFNIPNRNNGTKIYKRILNNHVFSNAKDIEKMLKTYCNSKYQVEKEHIIEFNKFFLNSDHKGGIVLAKHSDKDKYNEFLSQKNCAVKINGMPRMGIHGIMLSLLNDEESIFLSHFSINPEDDKNHLYVNVHNDKKPNCHNEINEYKIIIWLHEHEYIDATLSLLQNKVLPTLDCSFIKPKSYMLKELLKNFGICILLDYYRADELNILEDEYDNVFTNHKEKIEKSAKEECSNDERIFHVEKYSDKIKTLFNSNSLFEECAKSYNKRLKKKTLINKVEFKEGVITNSGAGWHRDNHNCQFKALMYLTDVNENNGNFQFITNSSKKYIGNPKPRTQNYNTRFADETVTDLLNKNESLNIHNIIGKRGTIVLVDTTYIHRGNIIKEGMRKAITQYFFD